MSLSEELSACGAQGRGTQVLRAGGGCLKQFGLSRKEAVHRNEDRG